MSEEVTNAASTAEAPKAELKSTDTSALSAMKTAAEAPKSESKTEPTQSPTEGDGAGDDPEGDAAAADAPEDKRKKQRLPRWVQERLARERLVTEQRTREKVLAELQQQSPRRDPTNVEHAEREKTLEDFDFDSGKYLDYKVQQGIEREKQQQRRADVERQQAEDVEKFKAKIDRFEEKAGAGSWEDIESSPINTDPAYKPLVDLFLGDDNDLEIAHHLAMNPDEAARILSLSPLARVREIAKLSESFDTPPQGKPAPTPPKKVTNAPPPPKTVSGGGKSTPSEDDEGITPEQRIAIWRAKRKR